MPGIRPAMTRRTAAHTKHVESEHRIVVRVGQFRNLRVAAEAPQHHLGEVHNSKVRPGHLDHLVAVFGRKQRVGA
jgi:hypothetical protein